MMYPDGLSVEALSEGSDAYVRYCSGLAIVQFPEATVGIHNRPEIEENVQEIYLIAEEIMIESVKKIISAVHDPDSEKLPKNSFNENVPKLRQVVESASISQSKRLDIFNTMYAVIRPAPFLQKPIYTKIAEARYARLSIEDLTDGFEPHKIFDDLDVAEIRARNSRTTHHLAD